MKRQRIIEIRKDVVEQWLIPKGGIRQATCSQCTDPSSWLSLAQAIALSKSGPAKLCQLAEDGRLHSSITPDGHLLLCAGSIAKYLLEKGENKS